MPNDDGRLSEDEFRAMLDLIRRYGTHEMDQFDCIELATEFGPLYIDISRSPGGHDSYRDLTHLLVR